MPLRTLGGCLFVLLLLPAPSPAQVYSLPTPAPAVSAVGHDWFDHRLPILYAGDRYYPAGPRYHFDPNVMVLAGTFGGVPLYVDTAAQPYSQLFVPIGGGLVQPYERRRAGDIAGTTGSHAPEFPVEILPWEESADMRIARPGGFQPLEGAAEAEGEPTPQRRVPSPEDEETRARLLEPPGHIETIRVPEDNRGIWILYEGQRWGISGKAVPFDAGRFTKIGEYAGFPVYSTRGTEEIYIPAARGMLAVYAKDAR